jgi:N-acetylmuramic acid 6-phosphate etherase
MTLIFNRKEIQPAESKTATYLGIECGGTRTVVLFGPGPGGRFQRAEFGPANLRLLDDAALVKHFKAVKRAAGAAFTGMVIGMAGARTEKDRRRIRAAAGKVWPGVPVYATDDLETALAAASGRDRRDTMAKVLILSGTGSCCFGRRNGTRGGTVRLGGWGHILGDRGSGYAIGLGALRAVAGEMDRQGQWPALGESILRALQLNEADDLIDWAKGAEKCEVAALAPTVFAAAAKRDHAAQKILADAAVSLAEDGANCARRLAGEGAPVEFVLAGGILLKQAGFARQVGTRLRQLRPGSRVRRLRRESVWGAIELARQHFGGVKPARIHLAGVVAALPDPPEILPICGALPATEELNPRSRNLDRMSLARAVALMIEEESAAGAAIFKERRKIQRAVEMIAHALGHGGRLFYAGAGTSGRLGILDASECPPTFRLPPDRVQGIIAGGRAALWQSVEGAEDDAAAGAAALVHRGVKTRDVVVGIAAGGRTPFVWGALGEARKRGARTILLCCNPRLEIPAARRPDLVIAPDTGPEVLTGSTRLKAGTATKIILNIFTTLAMVRLGKVMGNLMADLHPCNEKLRARAVRMVQTLTGAGAAAARAALEKAMWRVKKAREMLRERIRRQAEQDVVFLQATSGGAPPGPNAAELREVLAVQRAVRKKLKRRQR